MKKIISIVIITAILLMLASCGGNSENNSDAETTRAISVSEDAESVDIDLTKLSNTMVYSQLYNMVTKPDNYIGKTVKLRGKYSVYDGDNRKYYVCEVMDETACCSQGLEFVLADSEEYPEYNPDMPKSIEVCGTFNTYTEDNASYVQIENATIKG